MAVLGPVWWEYWGRAAVLGSTMVGVSRGRLAVLGCPPDPLTNSERYWGIPWPHEQTRGTVLAGMYIA